MLFIVPLKEEHFLSRWWVAILKFAVEWTEVLLRDPNIRASKPGFEVGLPFHVIRKKSIFSGVLFLSEQRRNGVNLSPYSSISHFPSFPSSLSLLILPLLFFLLHHLYPSFSFIPLLPTFFITFPHSFFSWAIFYFLFRAISSSSLFSSLSGQHSCASRL